MTFRLCAVALTFGVAACGGGEPSADGPAVFLERHSDGNVFACATCHALDEPAPDGFIRPGHPIGDAAARPSFKNGQFTDLLDAVNTCRREWMVAPAFESDDPRWVQLRSFLEERAPDTAPALTIMRVDPPTEVEGGDAEAGRTLFNGRCIVCHGEDGVGTVRAPRITGLGLMPDYIAERVRRSGFEDSTVYPGLSGGRMPFWSADRLSDEQLLDVASYVHNSLPPGAGTDGGAGPDGGDRQCDATHARVGYVANLVTNFHGVSGTATIVDDCTVRIEMFDFDGQGVDVRLYGAAGGNYASGYAMSDDLRRSGGWSNETIIAKLPEGETLDDLDGISVWCVPVGVSFGDGWFSAP